MHMSLLRHGYKLNLSERNGMVRHGLFTLLVDYRGGTYISQVKAATPDEALRRWAKGHEPHNVQHLGGARRKRLAETIDATLREQPPARINTVTNVWLTMPLSGMFVNVVKTARR
jgi:hypothetical protein